MPQHREDVNSDWDVEDHTYEDGLGVDEWIRKYGEAIAECLPLDDVDADLRALYWAFTSMISDRGPAVAASERLLACGLLDPNQR